MATRLQQQGRTGRCDTSLTSKTVSYLRETCSNLGIAVSGTGASGNMVKEDYVSAIWVYSIDFSSIEETYQDDIRRFIAFLLKKTVPEMTTIAREHFQAEISSRKKGDICQRILEVLAQDPELPPVPGFHSTRDDSVTAATETQPSDIDVGNNFNTFNSNNSERAYSYNDIMSVLQFVGVVPGSGATTRTQTSVPRPTPQPARTTPTAARPQDSVSKNPSPDNRSASNASARVAQRIREIAAAMRKDPANAALFAPALEEEANKICKV